MRLKEPKKEVIQNHHVWYPNECGENGITVSLPKRDHFLITKIKRYKGLSPNFWIVMLYEATKKLQEELK